MNFTNILLVGAGGFLGSAARYAVVASVGKRFQTLMPWGTFAVNVAGSLILGVIIGLIARKSGVQAEWKLFLGTGFCGGFTTFSAFAAENLQLLQQKHPGTALGYILLSVAAGLMAVWLGFILAKNIA